MSIQTKIISKLYLKKLEMSLIYDFASRKLKGFSEEIFLRMREFHTQDINHATSLHGFLFLLESSGQQIEDLAIKPFCIAGLGEKVDKQNSEEEDKDAFIQMSLEFMKSLEQFELEIRDSIHVAMFDSDLNDLSKTQLNFQDLITISEHRVLVFRDATIRIKKMALYSRANSITWKCRYCGLTLEDENAPENCSCCNADLSFMAAGSWMIP